MKKTQDFPAQNSQPAPPAARSSRKPALFVCGRRFLRAAVEGREQTGRSPRSLGCGILEQAFLPARQLARPFSRSVVKAGGLLAAGLLLVSGRSARALGLERARFVVIEAKTGQPILGAKITIEDLTGRHAPLTLIVSGPSSVVNLRGWQAETEPSTTLFAAPTRITLMAGASVTLQNQTAPVKDIYIKVTAARLQARTSQATTGTVRDNREIGAFVNKTSGDLKTLTQGQSGVASDSNGQQHVRGEHSELTYVVDGVPLPDTLSGRQGSVVVPSTINSLEILTGSYAPEFGGQTAAILNITTLPNAPKNRADLTFQGGSYDTTNGDFTLVGPLGKRASYVVNLGGTRTRNAIEPQQPDDQTAHNAGSDLSYFTKLRLTPSTRDALTLTLSSNPSTLQISNRTGLPASFAGGGQGFGFLGLRNADGTRPDVTPDTAGLLGADTLPLPSQQAAGQDITQREVSEFATLAWQRRLSARDTGLLALTVLHSGQDIHNQNPAVDVLNLPTDNSIEYNPTATRNIHHVQIAGSLGARRGAHQFKTGLLLDDQYGSESYQIVPGSQLALDELAALAGNLAPAGSARVGADGSPVLDVNGNPVFAPTSGASPTLAVRRAGFYRAAYAQDTWQVGRRFVANYGLRVDWYKQTQNLGQTPIDTAFLSPRLNFSYTLDRASALRWSYNRLFNTPPLAQGAVVGQPILPEVLDQYDLSYERQVARGQTLKLAYYVKDIRNQVDTGLFIPGSQIGLYSAVNLQIGAVHGLEFSYDLVPTKGYGWDAYLNYSYSLARPNGLDNTGANVPDYNDHDQRNTVGFGLAYLWKGGASVAVALEHGSGLASSVIAPSDHRNPRTQVDLRLTTGPRVFEGHGGVGLDIANLFDSRQVINYQSAFSGTRFQQGRRILFSVFGNF